MPTVSKKVKSLTTKTAEARLAKMRLQVDRLRMDNKRLRGEVGPIDKLRQEVIGCNTTAKLQILSAPIRIGPELELTLKQIEGIKQELMSVCNDLAFGNLRPIHECPTCGAKLKDAVREVE